MHKKTLHKETVRTKEHWKQNSLVKRCNHPQSLWRLCRNRSVNVLHARTHTDIHSTLTPHKTHDSTMIIGLGGGNKESCSFRMLVVTQSFNSWMDYCNDYNFYFLAWTLVGSQYLQDLLFLHVSIANDLREGSRNAMFQPYHLALQRATCLGTKGDLFKERTTNVSGLCVGTFRK